MGASDGFKRQVVRFLILICLVLLAPGPALAAEIDQVREAIRATGARWVAQENPISRLSQEEFQKRLGGLREEVPLEAVPAIPRELAVPTAFDWRAAPGGNFVTPVRDQGACGSCFVFGPVAALEAKALITFNWPGVNLNLSEQIVLSCSGAGNCAAGGYASQTSDFLKNTGTNLETCYPYTATDGNCGSACANWQNYVYKFASWYWVAGAGASVNDLKNAIYDNGPVVAWMAVYTDFKYYSSGIYQQTWGTNEGGHFVLLIGYNDNDQALIGKNSWNTTWGESGYFRIAYSQVGWPVEIGYNSFGYGTAIGPAPPPSGKGVPWILLLD